MGTKTLPLRSPFRLVAGAAGALLVGALGLALLAGPALANSDEEKPLSLVLGRAPAYQADKELAKIRLRPNVAGQAYYLFLKNPNPDSVRRTIELSLSNGKVLYKKTL